MKILGIYYGHNATVCYLEDGVIKAAVSEERFTNVKNQRGIPKMAIDWILKNYRLKGDDFDLVVVPVKTNAPIYASDDSRNRSVPIKVLNLIYHRVPIINQTFGLTSFYNQRLRPLGRLFYDILASTIGSYTALQERRGVADFLNIHPNKVKAFDHHLCHAFGAYYGSPLPREESLVLTLDAEGDGLCASVRIFNGNEYRLLSVARSEHSIGYLYQAVTEFLGMKPLEHEYKVMGLAPYAKGEAVEKAYNKVKGLFWIGGLTGLEFVSKFDMHQSLKFLRKEIADVRFDIVAAAFQRLTEETVVAWVKKCIRQTGIKKVCLAGGVFMNVKANQKIAELPEVESLFVFPSCGDESTPIGAAYLGTKEISGETKLEPIRSLYLGPSFDNEKVKEEIKKQTSNKRYQVEYFENIEGKVAQLLAEGKIVARMSGSMEWGARALGNRSILAHPQNPDVVREINEQVKNRDFWMPFAPSILAEDEDRYIINPKHISAPYMILSFETTALGRKYLKAAIHPHDFTARPQIVTAEMNPKYHSLISEFKKLTDIGAVLNTSFNLHGYPIVLGPQEALRVFENSGLKHLQMENYLISK
ncbi:MAG: hypothetical protein M1352_03105 [Patescibacteria group bacterium]|nr:hypothetical protein [Patescibacteria group bacterium]